MTEMQTPTQRWPLLFKYQDVIFGNGFIAEVETHGRVLATHEDGAIWMYGVQPGGLAAHGVNTEAAHMAFRTTYLEILFDIASEATRFEDFEARVVEFFNEVCEPAQSDWWAAVEEVRRGLTKAPGLHKKDAASNPPFVKVLRKQKFSAHDNEPQLTRAIAA